VEKPALNVTSKSASKYVLYYGARQTRTKDLLYAHTYLLNSTR